MGFVVPLVAAAGSAIVGGIGALGTAAAGTAAAIGSSAAAAASAAGTAGTIGTALSAAGALYGGIAQNQAAHYQAKVANMNAALQDRQKQNALIAGADKESKLKMAITRMVASQRAAEAANGVDVDVGSAQDIADSTRLEGAADVATLHYQAMQEAYGYEQQAWSQRAQAKMDKAAGRQALYSGILQAGGTLLSGASSLAKNNFNNKLLGLGQGGMAHEAAHAYGGA